MSDLTSLWNPRSVAVIGASANPAKLGHTVLKNIIEGGFAGDISAVNPKGGAILGVPTYASIDNVPQAPELVVLAIPAVAVAEVVDQCGQAGVQHVIVLAAGFTETGESGAAREQELKEIIAKHPTRMLGPNCLGVIDPPAKLNASFAGSMPKPGPIAVVSQSGAMCTAILDWAKQTGLGFSRFISIGNQGDISENELLAELAADDYTKVVLGYLEGITDGRKFLLASSRLTRRKPFVLIKAGTSERGASAVGSHTGSLTGSEDALKAALQQAGVTRADSIQEMLDFTQVFSHSPLPAGDRVGIVTNAGGPGVITTDAVATTPGIAMAELDPKTQGNLRAILPAEAAVGNPVDLIGDARADRYERGLAAVLVDKGVDSAVVLLTPQAMTEIDQTAAVISKAAKQSNKPIVAAFIGGEAVASGITALEAAGVAVYPTPDRAVRALGALSEYAAFRRSKPPTPIKPNPPKAARTIIEKALDGGHTAILGEPATKLAKQYGIKVPEVIAAGNAASVAAAAKKVGYPVVMKIDSPDILHKTDAGGVALGLADEAAVRSTFQEMMTRVGQEHPQAILNGVTVSRHLPEGQDFLVGSKRDPIFGPVIVVGYGGIFVEVFKDVSFGLAPLDQDRAAELIDATKASALLAGVRGQETLDRKALEKAVVAVSKIANDFPEIAEFELNPIRVFPKGAEALDIRVILRR